MGTLIAVSILLRLVAFGWSLLLLRQVRDWRMALLSAGLGLMALRQILTLAQGPVAWSLRDVTPSAELPAVLVSLLALALVAKFSQMLTEGRRAESALRKIEARYALATGNARVGVWDWDLETNEIYVDPRLKEMLGYRDEEIRNHLDDWGALVHPEDAPAVMEAAQRYLEGGSSAYVVEHRMLHRDGRVLWYLAQGAAVCGEDGKPCRMVGTDIDITERKQAQQELEAFEARYRELFEDAPLKYVITRSRDGMPFIHDCNRQFLSAVGCESEEVVGRPLADFYTEESRRALIDQGGYQRALEGESIAEERQLLTKDGKVIETLVRVVPERDAAGKAIGTRALYTDITERKRAEAALKRSEARFAEAQRVARMGLWEWNIDTGEAYWSDESYRLYGLERGSFQPTLESFMAVVHPEDRAMIEEAIRATLSDNAPYRVDFRGLHTDGGVVTITTEGRLERDAEGRPVRLIGTALDVTEQRAAEQALRDSEERYRAVFEASADALWIRKLDDGEVIDVNPAMAEMYGYTREEMLALPTSAFVSETSLAQFEEALAVVGQGERTWIAGQCLRKDGSLFHVEGFFVPFASKGKTLALGILRDVTERNRAQNQLLLSRQRLRNLATRLESVREEERRAMAREIHDELGQSLTALKMELSWLSGRVGDTSAREKERIDSMYSLTDKTIESVRALSARLRPAVLDDLGLHAAIEWQAEEFGGRFGIDCDLSLEAIEVPHDAALACYRILQEALTNIARHARAKRVKIALRPEDQVLELQIADDGKGIDGTALWSPDSHGLTSMRERAGRLGGELRIARGASGGTVVTARIPL